MAALQELRAAQQIYAQICSAELQRAVEFYEAKALDALAREAKT